MADADPGRDVREWAARQRDRSIVARQLRHARETFPTTGATRALEAAPLPGGAGFGRGLEGQFVIVDPQMASVGETVKLVASSLSEGKILWNGFGPGVRAGFTGLTLPTTQVPVNATAYYGVTLSDLEVADRAGGDLELLRGNIQVEAFGGTRGKRLPSRMIETGVLTPGTELSITCSNEIVMARAAFYLIDHPRQIVGSGSQVLSWIPTANRPDGLAWDGASLWVACAGPNRIYEHDPDTGAVLSDFAAPAVAGSTAVHGMTFDGTNLWVARDGGTAAQHRIFEVTRAGTPVSSFVQPAVSTRGNVNGLEWDGTGLWLSTAGDGQLRRYNTTGTVLQSGPFPSPGSTFVQGIHWAGTGFFATCATDDTVYQTDTGWSTTATFDVVPGTQGPSTAGVQDIVLNGGIAYIANTADHRIYRVQL